jgi:hypothetical protein
MICKTVRRLFDWVNLSFGNRPHPPAPSPTPLQGDDSGGFAVLFDGEGEPEQLLKVPLPELGEGFRVRATKVRCSLPTRTKLSGI